MPIPSLPEHKIGVFVRFWGLEPLFSGVSSTKSRFLCALPVASLHSGPCQQQTSSGVSVCATAPPACNKPHLAEKISGLASNLAYLGRIC